MSRFSKIIDQLEDLDQQDLKHTAKVFGITAELYQKLQNIATEKSPLQSQLSSQKVTQQQLMQRYGNYTNAYKAYKSAYGIKCRGWKSLLPLVQDLQMPETLAEKVAVLEKKVAVLSEILLSVTRDV